MAWGAETAAVETTVQVVTKQGTEFEGVIAAWTAERLDLVGREVHQLPTADLVSLRFPQQRVQPAAGEYVVLTQGDRLAISALKIKDEQLTATWRRAPLRPMLKIPLERVTGVLFDLPPAPREIFAQLGAMAALPAGADRLRFLTGDELTGQLETVDGGLVTFRGALGATSLDQRRLRRLTLDPELADRSLPPAAHWILLLTDGSRCTVKKISPRDDFSLSAEPLVGEPFLVPWHELAALNRFAADVLPLARRQPMSAAYVEFLASGTEPDPVWQSDRNCQRQPFFLAGREYTTGLGVTSQTTLTYAIEPGDAAFRAVVGIDDLAGSRGSAKFRILVDGRDVWSSPERFSGQPPLATPLIDLQGKQTFTLAVDFGSRGDLGSLANWCDAVLIRKP